MSFISTNPLRRVAIQLGRLPAGARDLGLLPVEAYQSLVAELNRLNRSGTQGQRRLSQEGAELLAHALLSGTPLAAVTFICVSDYVGSTRYRQQAGQFQLTPKEREMLERAATLRQRCADTGFTLQWRLVLADAWGKQIFNDRVLPGALDAYCAMMQAACEQRGFTTVRWTSFMASQGQAYTDALSQADARITEAMVRWEATVGEIAHDKVTGQGAALAKARQHIRLRAAEGPVLVAAFGPQLVLSTESRSLQRYDNLVVPRAQYAGHDYMPKYPHRLD